MDDSQLPFGGCDHFCSHPVGQIVDLLSNFAGERLCLLLKCRIGLHGPWVFTTPPGSGGGGTPDLFLKEIKKECWQTTRSLPPHLSLMIHFVCTAFARRSHSAIEGEGLRRSAGTDLVRDVSPLHPREQRPLEPLHGALLTLTDAPSDFCFYRPSCYGRPLHRHFLQCGFGFVFFFWQ